MIVKVVAKEHVTQGEYYHEFLVEADRFEIQYHKEWKEVDPYDWFFTDQLNETTKNAFVVRAWKDWPNATYVLGVVRSGRIFVVNESGKTVDKYVI